MIHYYDKQLNIKKININVKGALITKLDIEINT